MKRITIAILFICITAISCQQGVKTTKHFSCDLFELDYPTNWIAQENTVSPEQLLDLNVIMPKHPITDLDPGVAVVISALPTKGKSLDDFIAKNKQDFPIEPSNIKEEGTCELGGLKAHCITAKIPFMKEAKIMGKLIMLIKGDQFVMVTYLASGGNYPEYVNDFERIAKSFKFK